MTIEMESDPERCNRKMDRSQPSAASSEGLQVDQERGKSRALQPVYFPHHMIGFVRSVELTTASLLLVVMHVALITSSLAVSVIVMRGADRDFCCWCL